MNLSLKGNGLEDQSKELAFSSFSDADDSAMVTLLITWCDDLTQA